MKINIRDGITIDVRSDKSLYITIGNYTYYIDDSTGEQIMDFWETNKPSEETFATINQKASTVDSKVKKNLPLKPHQVYNEWTSWSDFLGVDQREISKRFPDEITGLWYT